MREREDELDALGVRVAIVTFETGPVAGAYVRESQLSWPLLIDESRSLYAAYDMHRGRWSQILGPAAWWAYVKLLARGRQLHRTTGDVTQLGGDVLIDPQGIVRLHHVGSGPADRPAVESLLAVVRAGV